MTIKEVAFSEGVATRLVALSKEWERENSCYGYRGNNSEDFKDKRIFCCCGRKFGLRIFVGAQCANGKGHFDL